MSTKRIRRLGYVISYPVGLCGHSYCMAPFALRLVRDPSQLFSEVILIAPAAGNDTFTKEENRGQLSEISNITVRLLPSVRPRPWRWVRQLPLLWTYLREVDLVCAHLPEELAFLTALICRVTRKPFLLQVVGDWSEAILVSGPPGTIRSLKARISDWMNRVTIQTAGLVFAQGQALFDKAVSLNPSATKSVIAQTTLVEEAFYERSSSRLHDPVRILTVCTLEPRKGLDLLARAIKNLRGQGARVEWWCVGRGPSEAALKALTKSLGIDDLTQFFGYVPLGVELFRLYQQADIFVLPSYHEGVPHAMLEAMAHSLPIVATAVGGIPQVVTDDVEGILIPPGDPGCLADAVAQLIDDYRLAGRMGHAAFAKAQAFRPSVLLQEHRSLIESTFGKIDGRETTVQSGDLTGVPRGLSRAAK